MLADISSDAVVVPGAEVNNVEDMTGDLELDAASVLYVSGEESIQQVVSTFNAYKGARGASLPVEQLACEHVCLLGCLPDCICLSVCLCLLVAVCVFVSA